MLIPMLGHYRTRQQHYSATLSPISVEEVAAFCVRGARYQRHSFSAILFTKQTRFRTLRLAWEQGTRTAPTSPFSPSLPQPLRIKVSVPFPPASSFIIIINIPLFHLRFFFFLRFCPSLLPPPPSIPSPPRTLFFNFVLSPPFRIHKAGGVNFVKVAIWPELQRAVSPRI